MENDITNILNELTKIETAADRLADDNEKTKQALLSEFEKHKSEFYAQLKEESAKRLADIEKELSAVHSERLDELRKHSEDERARYDKLFNDNREELISKIIKNILEG